ncbi:Gentisate transporter [Corynebacterium provencense]|uniref:Gentisate transporter n=1 Tax=Corynebacterium provencense TaxID=1737425 RepID=A0A2Z3YSC9_9CORY|nr:aromatic acid/H+ symport family MFS transporter [Corynebacterium provencense]AWT27199.1 Gentisate transporter [Corynebacterium provencense]
MSSPSTVGITDVTTPTGTSTDRLPYGVMAVCGTAIAFDGYDIVVYGTTLSKLREEWGLSSGTAGLVGSSALVGMFVGAILVGTFAARWGRRRAFLGCVTWFSVLMILCAAAPGPEVFAVVRFLAGIGLGGVMPLAAALTTEFSPVRRRAVAYVIMQSGYPVGGVAAALLAKWVVPAFSWHWMYLIAALPLVTVLPAARRWLPESREVPAGTPAEHRRHAARDGLRIIFSPTFRATTVLFWAMSFCSLLFVYGANTWLPTLMQDAGRGFSSSLNFLLYFNLGAIVGGVAAGVAADRWGSKIVVTASFLVGAAAVLCFAGADSTALLLILAAFAGYGAVATQTLINGWVTRSYPATARTTGVGWSLGIGRIGGIVGPSVTGAIVSATGGGTAAFLLFAAVGVIGALLAAAVNQRH